jgi:hypothetical protein
MPLLDSASSLVEGTLIACVHKCKRARSSPVSTITTFILTGLLTQIAPGEVMPDSRICGPSTQPQEAQEAKEVQEIHGPVMRIPMDCWRGFIPESPTQGNGTSRVRPLNYVQMII